MGFPSRTLVVRVLPVGLGMHLVESSGEESGLGPQTFQAVLLCERANPVWLKKEASRRGN